MNRVLFTVATILLLSTITGCANNTDNRNANQLSLMKTSNSPPSIMENKQQLTTDESITEKVVNEKEIYDVVVVKGKKEVLVAYKVKHLHRFKMKNIEKKIKKTLDEKFPEEQFVVSSDYKIFLEARKLSEKMRNPNYSEKKANKKLQDIITLKEELT